MNGSGARRGAGRGCRAWRLRGANRANTKIFESSQSKCALGLLIDGRPRPGARSRLVRSPSIRAMTSKSWPAVDT